LPFTGDASLVAGFLDDIAKCCGAGIKETEPDIVAGVGHTGHDLYPAGCADWLGVGMLKAHSAFGKTVEEWGLIVSSTIGAKAFISHVVSHDQDEVGMLLGRDQKVWCEKQWEKSFKQVVHREGESCTWEERCQVRHCAIQSFSNI
jgi:hypothetical protein